MNISVIETLYNLITISKNLKNLTDQTNCLSNDIKNLDRRVIQLEGFVLDYRERRRQRLDKKVARISEAS